jgi:hypothetical protein
MCRYVGLLVVVEAGPYSAELVVCSAGYWRG